jgi:carbon monoxide dehydrogenase subunit G
MPISLQETFRVTAPIDAVWAYVMDAHRVAGCMPGAALDDVVDEQTFLGTIRVKVGAITTSYKGKVRFVEVDVPGRSVRLSAEGREAGGGTAKGTMSSRLRAISANETEVVVDASVDLTGRIAQVSRGMIQGVSQQLFQQFVACAKASLETPEQAAAAIEQASKPVSVLPLMLRALRTAIANFFRRLFRRNSA